ncbi:MAG TPA: metallophosphoesterase [Gammaproteobacteria bacterium]|nr:metallophosphoesterase [Gammaproteobacteria bacterium]
MKIAVLSDVHGNIPALDAVLDDIEVWGADEIIVNGDLVSRGPRSLACLERLQARTPKGRFLAGNHESYVIHCAENPADPADPLLELRRFSDWTAAQLGPLVAELKSWPDHLDWEDMDGASVHITHGSRLGHRRGILPDMGEKELAARLGTPRDLFICSHTHHPLRRQFHGTEVVNTGSVGQPLDGDPRAAYGRFVFHRGRWQADIARVPFDTAQAARDVVDSGFLEECGPIARLIYLEVTQARTHVAAWRRHYLARVEAGELSVAEAVGRYLQTVGV